MKFSDITGLTQAKSILRDMADSGRIPHAILLHGPAGIGKMRLARAFIQYLLCENPSNGDSCGICPACRQNELLNNPDLHFIYPIIKKSSPKRTLSSDYLEEWKNMLDKHSFMQPEHWLEELDAGNSQPAIYVTDSDEINRLASMSAMSSDYKVFVIWQPEKMQVEAANKLLKLIEEPFFDTIFLLVSDNPDALLPTIFSRTQRVAASRLSDSEMMEWLHSKGVSNEDAPRLTYLSEGKPAVVEGLIDASGESGEFGEYFRNAMRNAYVANAGVLKELSDKFAALGRTKALRLCNYFSSQIRENFIYNLHNPQLNLLSDEEAAFSARFAPFVHAGNVEKIIKEIDSARTDISRNANAKLVWFDFLLHLMMLIRIKPQ